MKFRRIGAVLLGGALLAAGLVTPASAGEPVPAEPGICSLDSVQANDRITAALNSTVQTVRIETGCEDQQVTCAAAPEDDPECYAYLEKLAGGFYDPSVPVYADNEFDSVTARFTYANGSMSPAVTARRTAEFEDVGFNRYLVWELDRTFTYRTPAGLTKVTVTAKEDSQTFTRTDSFYIRRNAKIDGFGSAPEERLVNSNLTSTGKLTRLTETGKYVPWGGKEVIIEFRAVNTSSWVRVGSDLTDSTGYFAKTVRTKKDGHWRARAVRTSSTHGPTSGADYVNVTNYANCSAVPASLKPLTRTDPGYEPKLDGDSDGLACE